LTVLKRVETWLWFIRDGAQAKLRITRHRMTADDAETIYPGAVRVPGSMEYIEIGQSKDAELGLSIDAWLRGAEAAPDAGD
jgi:hypothetical protein